MTKRELRDTESSALSEPSSTRLFAGIELDESLRASLVARQEMVRAQTSGGRLRWVRAPNLHLTLRFFGALGPEVMGPLLESLGAACRVKPFRLEVKGLGCFPKPEKARILWAGIPAPPTELMALHERLEGLARTLGLAPDRKKYSPHITLARVKAVPAGFSSSLKKFEEVPSSRPGPHSLVTLSEIGGMDVRSVALYESNLEPSGARYSVVRRFALD